MMREVFLKKLIIDLSSFCFSNIKQDSGSFMQYCAITEVGIGFPEFTEVIIIFSSLMI